jgi:hypothetical protein
MARKSRNTITERWAHQISETPGFRVEELADGWKAFNSENAMVKLPQTPNTNGCSVPNLRTRLGHIGWTEELWKAQQERLRAARIAADRGKAERMLAAMEAQMQGDSNRTDVAGGDDVAAILAQPPLRGPNGMTTRYELITPEVALELITATPDGPGPDGKRLQRKQGRDRVVVLTEAMRRGEYFPTHQGIAVDKEGRVVDGLHRLKAAFEADTTLIVLVTRDLPEKAMPVIDIGKSRTHNDWFTMAGEKSGSHLASLLKVIYLVDNVSDQTRWDRYPSLTKVQLQQVIDRIDAELAKDPSLPDPREAVRQGNRLKIGAKLNMTGACAAWWLIRRANPAPASVETYDPADDFFHRLRTGVSLPDLDPILALRNWLDPDAQKRRRSSESAKKRPPHLLHLYLVLKAWESWAKKEKKHGIAYSPDFIVPEPIVYSEVR